ncbi:hypothetical protein ABK040_009051 [Willaertia magna]
MSKQEKESKVVVTVRCRPFIPSEMQEGNKKEEPSFYISGNAIEIIKDNKDVIGNEATNTLAKTLPFDYVFDEIATTPQIYDQVLSHMVPSVCEGYNCTVFAYGQTASGKTFTMKGTEENPGVIRLAIRAIFDQIKNNEDENRTYLIRVSYLEIYNEKVRDLLSPEQRLVNIFVDKNKNLSFDNLTEEIIRDEDEAMRVLQRGTSNVIVAKTIANDSSSRSHTIFRMIVERKDELVVDNNNNNNVNVSTLTKRPKSKQIVRIGNLNLVDLAGSENSSEQLDDKRRKEGQNINLSLLHLKEIITRLSNGEKVHSFRNSKLTRILGDSLGGNAKVAVICTISPDPEKFKETKRTLEFGSNAQKISIKPVVNSECDNALILKYQTEIETMQNEIKELRDKLKDQVNQKDEESQEETKEQLEQLESVMNELSTSMVTNRSLLQKLQDIENEKREREEKILEMEQEKRRLEELLKLEEENKRKQEEETRNKEITLIKLQEETCEMSKKLEEIRQAKTDLELKSHEKETQLNELMKRSSILEEKVNNEELSRKKAEDLVREQIKQIEMIKERNIEIEKEYKKEKEAKEEASKLVEKNMEEMKQVKLQLYATNNQKKEMESQLQGMNDSIHTMYETWKEDFEREIKKRDVEISELNDLNAKLTQQLFDKEEQITQLQKTQSVDESLTQFINDLENENRKLKKLFEQQEFERKSLHEKTLEVFHENKTLKLRIVTLESEIEAFKLHFQMNSTGTTTTGGGTTGIIVTGNNGGSGGNNIKSRTTTPLKNNNSSYSSPLTSLSALSSSPNHNSDHNNHINSTPSPNLKEEQYGNNNVNNSNVSSRPRQFNKYSTTTHQEQQSSTTGNSGNTRYRVTGEKAFTALDKQVTDRYIQSQQNPTTDDDERSSIFDRGYSRGSKSNNGNNSSSGNNGGKKQKRSLSLSRLMGFLGGKRGENDKLFITGLGSRRKSSTGDEKIKIYLWESGKNIRAEFVDARITIEEMNFSPREEDVKCAFNDFNFQNNEKIASLSFDGNEVGFTWLSSGKKAKLGKKKFLHLTTEVIFTYDNKEAQGWLVLLFGIDNGVIGEVAAGLFADGVWQIYPKIILDKPFDYDKEREQLKQFTAIRELYEADRNKAYLKLLDYTKSIEPSFTNLRDIYQFFESKFTIAHRNNEEIIKYNYEEIMSSKMDLKLTFYQIRAVLYLIAYHSQPAIDINDTTKKLMDNFWWGELEMLAHYCALAAMINNLPNNIIAYSFQTIAEIQLHKCKDVKENYPRSIQFVEHYENKISELLDSTVDIMVRNNVRNSLSYVTRIKSILYKRFLDFSKMVENEQEKDEEERQIKHKCFAQIIHIKEKSLKMLGPSIKSNNLYVPESNDMITKSRATLDLAKTYLEAFKEMGSPEYLQKALKYYSLVEEFDISLFRLLFKRYSQAGKDIDLALKSNSREYNDDTDFYVNFSKGHTHSIIHHLVRYKDNIMVREVHFQQLLKYVFEEKLTSFEVSLEDLEKAGIPKGPAQLLYLFVSEIKKRVSL